MTLRLSAAAAMLCLTMLVWPAGRATDSTGAVVDATAAAPKASAMWLAPESLDLAARQTLARAVADLAAGRSVEPVQTFESATSDPVLGGYVLLFLGRAQLAAGKTAEAVATAQRLQATVPTGFLAESALVLTADAASAALDPASALAAVKQLAGGATIATPASVQLRLGRAALEAGDLATATRALTTLYFEYPLSPEASDASPDLARMASATKASPATFARILARAERLYAGKLYGDARSAFDSIKLLGQPDDRSLIALRLIECDFFTKRYTATSTGLRNYPTKGNPLAHEAEWVYLSTLRETNRTPDYLTRLRAFVDRNADPVLAERALNDLAAFYTRGDDDRKAAETFAEMYQRYPQGAFGERAAWKAGWWAYKNGDFATTIRLFESASIGMRHADSRPAWLFWAARAHMQMGQTDAGLAGYARTITDYRNTYYGRASTRESERTLAAMRPAGAGLVSQASLELPQAIVTGTPPANARLIRDLLAAGMYDEAIGELKQVQATAGTSPLVEATIAYALNRQGRLRPAITAMRRAYPQFMAAGGEALPEEILTVIFPVDHWFSIQQHAVAKNLDRFLVAALIAQESTFQADIRSSANAWGLMQILPSTGRQYAQRLSIRPFSTNRLTDPDTNLEIGTTYFADLLRRFGDVAPALAAYNAGESRVVRWLADRPGADQDEFIDNIPFFETQNYVKRILGTSEDYRRLYR